MNLFLSNIERELLRQGLLDLYVNSNNFSNVEKEIFINLYNRIKKYEKEQKMN
jgi:hypothetical protein